MDLNRNNGCVRTLSIYESSIVSWLIFRDMSLTFLIMCAIANRTSTRPPALLIADIASLFNASINPGTQWITNSVIKEPSLNGRTFIDVFSKVPDSFANSFISPSNWLLAPGDFSR